MADEWPHGYHLYDNIAKTRVGTYKTLKRARTEADKRDNAYGAYRYYPRRNEPPAQTFGLPTKGED